MAWRSRLTSFSPVEHISPLFPRHNINPGSFEFDNIACAQAVPEPAMILLPGVRVPGFALGQSSAGPAVGRERRPESPG
jgi:hypothetical protein